MKLLKFIPLVFFLLIVQACSSIGPKRQDTLAPSILDGAWIESKCTCGGKDANPPDIQQSHTLFINGNLVFQDQVIRWRKAEWNHYCSVHEEATINQATQDSYNVSTVSDRVFAPGETRCNILPAKSNRTWKIMAVNKSELKYESTTGCESGPLTCSYKRLDQ